MTINEMLSAICIFAGGLVAIIVVLIILLMVTMIKLHNAQKDIEFLKEQIVANFEYDLKSFSNLTKFQSIMCGWMKDVDDIILERR